MDLKRGICGDSLNSASLAATVEVILRDGTADRGQVVRSIQWARSNFLSPRPFAQAREMRLFRQLGGLALVLSVLGGGLVEASVGEPIEPTPSLAQRLRHWAEVFQAHPRNELGEYPVSQLVVDFIKAALDMVVDNLLEFTADKTCQSILKELEPGFGVPLVGSDKATTDYTQCREFRWSLSKLGNS